MAKLKDIRVGDFYTDEWYYEYGMGKVVEVLKTRVKIHFSEINKVMTYDRDHVKFLEDLTEV